MTRKQFLQWGKCWNYPFLVLEPHRILKHGEDAYKRATPLVILLASKRIERWNALTTPERVTEAIVHVDTLLIRCHGGEVDQVERLGA